MAVINTLKKILSSFNGQTPSTGKEVEDAFNDNFETVRQFVNGISNQLSALDTALRKLINDEINSLNTTLRQVISTEVSNLKQLINNISDWEQTKW